MPDICLQYILAVTLVDGSLSFDAAHSYERMRESSITNLRERISVVEDPVQSASENKRQGVVEVTTKEWSISERSCRERPRDSGEPHDP